MKSILLVLVAVILLSSCASQDEADLARLGPTIGEQKKEAKQREEFARNLPQPHP